MFSRFSRTPTCDTQTDRQTQTQTQTQAHWLVPRMRSIVRLKRKMVRKVSKTIIRTKSSHNCIQCHSSAHSSTNSIESALSLLRRLSTRRCPRVLVGAAPTARPAPLLLSAGACYLLPAANPPAAVAVVDRWDRQTDRQTDTRPFHRPW